jgi:hypothetical protein
LADIASGALPLCHEALDERPEVLAAEFLRHMLVSNGVLEERDDALVRLEAWVEVKIAAVVSSDHRRTLRSYATWRVFRRARLRAERANRPRTPTTHSRHSLIAAIAFLSFLDDRGCVLAECTQAELDIWMVEHGPSAHEVKDFIFWAGDRRLIERLVLKSRPRRPTTGLDDDTRWSIVERLLHDASLDLGDRVAGCLVMLYGQQLSRIVSLTKSQVGLVDNVVRLRLGQTEVQVPEPLGELLSRLASCGRPRRGLGTPPEPPWLFTGLHPGRPLPA